MKKHSLILMLTFSILASYNARAQQKEIGFNVGYGLTGITERQSFMRLGDYRFRHESPDVYVAGLSYSRQFSSSRLRFNTGINYFHRNLEHSGSSVYLNIPAGVEYLFGRKLKAGIGAGLYLNTRINKPRSDFRTLVLGEYLRAAVSYHFMNRYRVMFSWTGTSDITNMIRWQSSGYTGGLHTWEEIGFDSIFSLTVFYNINRK